MNRTQTAVYNSAATILLQAITIIAAFITPRVIITVYGSEINGLITSITQFISYFSLVEAGIGAASIYALYKPLANNDYKTINGIISAAKRFYWQAGYIFVVLIIGMAVTYPFLIKTNSLTPIYVGILVLTLGVAGILDFFTLSKYQVLLTADQRIYIISLASISNIVLNTVIIVIMAHFYINIVIVRIFALSSIIVRSIILIFYTKNKYKFINYNEVPNNDSLNNRWDVFYWQVTTNIQLGSTAVIATIFTNLATVSVYTVFNLIIGGVKSLLNVFTNGLYTSFGDIIIRNQLDTLQKVYQEFEFAYYNLIAIAFSVTMVTIMPFINIYTRGITDADYNVPLLGILFVVDGLMYTIKIPQGMLVQSAGLYSQTKRQVTIQGLIAVILGVMLAPYYGLPGIIVGMLISNIYRWIDLLFFIPRYVTKLPIKNTFFRQLRVFFSIAICTLPVLYSNIFNLHNPANYIQWFLLVGIVGLYSFVVVLILDLLFDRQELYNITIRIKTFYKK